MTRYYKKYSVSGCELTRRNTTSVTGTVCTCSGYRLHGRTIRIVYACILVLFLSFSVQAEDRQNHPVEIVPEKIVDSLPWTFNLTRDDLSGKGFPYFDTITPPDSLTRYSFASRNPIQQGRSREINLRISFFAGRYGNSSDARKQFHHLKESADPDIGLSYQWDFVTQNGQFIYHIHAECLLAEEHFFSLTKALTEMISPDGKNQLNQLLCRCGGGCQ